MAAVSQPQDNSEHVASRPRKENELFMPKETPDQRCDVILLVEDGKEFKAHKQVLSEASPFFEKLLNSDMKESREGIVRLEKFSESAMRNTLQFIYTGDVQILTEDNARDLVVSADYFFLPTLKPLAEAALVEMLNTSNCISAYYFSQRYQCQQLLAKSEKYILANFIAMYETNREEVLNMSNKEMEMWLSSDEINVSAEEDVFKITLAWIDHDRDNRQKYFAELFRHVRLIFASRDFLSSDILMNDLVKDNKSCLTRVVDAIKLIDSRNYGNLSISPRKSLETSVIVVTSAVNPSRSLSLLSLSSESSECRQSNLCYFPIEGRWCKLGDWGPHEYPGKEQFFCRGKLHFVRHSYRSSDALGLTAYDLYSNCLLSGLPDIDFDRVILFLVNDDEIYALVSEKQAVNYRTSDVTGEERKKCVSFILKYKVESNSWKEVTSVDHLRANENVCIVAKDDFVYFIGGEEVFATGKYQHRTRLTDVYRYNIGRNQWDKVADIQQPKTQLSGAACKGRIFIAGNAGWDWVENRGGSECEVYSETTNEWQFISSFFIRPGPFPSLLSVGDQLYALCRSEMIHRRRSEPNTCVKCYDPDKDEWIRITDIPAIRTHSNTIVVVKAYSGRVFEGFLSEQQLKGIHSEGHFPPASQTKESERKCVIA